MVRQVRQPPYLNIQIHYLNNHITTRGAEQITPTTLAVSHLKKIRDYAPVLYNPPDPKTHDMDFERILKM